MQSINHEQLVEVLKKVYSTRTPLYVWGEPGIGKSMGIRVGAQTMCASMKLKFSDTGIWGKDYFSYLDLRLSQFEPSDFRGIPMHVNGRAHWILPSFFP